VRHDDLPCRYGGEEFTVILPGVEENQGRVIAERIRQEFQGYQFKPHGIPVPPVTVSLGLAASEAGKAPKPCCSGPTRPLYLAKDRGKNQTVVDA
jgi:diguanylate cyclase (GGDEF)-like protein